MKKPAGVSRKRCAQLFLLLFLVIVSVPLVPHKVEAQEETSEEQLPVLITVSLGVIDIPKIDEPGETFNIDSYFFLEWNDSAAYEYITGHGILPQAETYKFYSNTEVQSILRDIGWPEIIQFTNQVGQRDILSSYLWISANGDVTYYERFQGTFHSKYQLRKYPFDSQKLNILIESAYYDRTMLEFAAPKDKVIFYESPTKPLPGDEPLDLEEWHLDRNIESNVGEYTSRLTGRSFSYVSIDITAHRKVGFHIWKIFLPLVLIIGISWSVFWIWTENVASRLSISMIGFLTAISFGFFISNSLPKISYLTFMDYGIIGIYVFMTLTVLEVLTTNFLTSRGKELVASRLNLYSRWLFPASFLMYLLVIALVIFIM